MPRAWQRPTRTVSRLPVGLALLSSGSGLVPFSAVRSGCETLICCPAVLAASRLPCLAAFPSRCLSAVSDDFSQTVLAFIYWGNLHFNIFCTYFRGFSCISLPSLGLFTSFYLALSAGLYPLQPRFSLFPKSLLSLCLCKAASPV